MSQRSVCGFALTILFISINLLSMDDYRLVALPAYSTNSRKEKGKPVPLHSPSFALYFEHQSIPLPHSTANNYQLIFNRNQTPSITHYLLEGEPVAKLIQIDNEITFKSDYGKILNFSVEIPYKAGSLTINTQGQFIFERKIDMHSACLKSKSVAFSAEFLTDNGITIDAHSCKSHAQLACSDFLFKGKEFEIMPKSSLKMSNSITLLAQSLIANEGVIDCNNESSMKSSLFKNQGTLTSHNMHFDGNKIANQGSLTIGDTFRCTAKFFEQNGMLDICDKCIIEKGDVVTSTPSSVWNVNGSLKAFANSFYLQGSFNIKDFQLVGKNSKFLFPLHLIAENAHLKIEEDITNDGVIKILGLLDVDAKNINLEKTSDITVDNVNLNIQGAIHNAGTFSVKNHLSAHARSITNGGKIETSSSNIKADRYFLNKILSTLHAKNNLTISTPLSLNFLGLTHAQSLTINSALGLNAFGIYAANNMCFNSLYCANAGLLIPKFSKFSQMTSKENL